MPQADPPSESSGMPGAALEADALQALVSRAQAGSRRAADRIVREHAGWIRGVVYGITGRRDLVDDVTQQVWAQFWERLPSIRDPRRLRSWLYTVARNAAVDAGQAARRGAMPALEQVGETASVRREHDPVRTVAGDEIRQIVLRAIESLPALYREPFVLRHLQDWSYAQIADLLGLPIETVETRLVRARRLLREYLQGMLDR